MHYKPSRPSFLRRSSIKDFSDAFFGGGEPSRERRGSSPVKTITESSESDDGEFRLFKRRKRKVSKVMDLYDEMSAPEANIILTGKKELFDDFQGDSNLANIVKAG